MAIDQSLSRGLSKRLILSWKEEVDLALSKLLNLLSKNHLSSRKDIKKFIFFHQQCFSRLAISYFVMGSKRKPYIALIALGATGDREYLNWTEGGIGGIVEITDVVNSKGRPTLNGRSPFFIGEHAINRIYQRSLDNNQVIDPYVIVKELSLVPLWSGFWIFLFLTLNDKLEKDKIDSITPIIPSKNGLFLCKVSNFDLENNFRSIEVRTFVQINQLTEEQLYIQNKLWNISNKIENTPINIYPHIYSLTDRDFVFEEIEFIFNFILNKIGSFLREFSSLVIKGDFNQYDLNKVINQIISGNKYNQTINNLLDETLINGNYEDFVDKLKIHKHRHQT